ncbi:MAG: large ribosomal subunit protein uL5, partial [Phycisphaerales bacterium]
MAKSAAIDPKDNGPAVAPRLRDQFKNEIAPKLKDEFGITNPNAWPKLEKIVLNVNMGRHIEGTKVPANIKDQILDTLTKITGQKPVVTKSKKSIAGFKIREDYPVGCMVTLRRVQMYEFLDRLVTVAIPRI